MHDAGAGDGVALFAQLVEQGGKTGFGFFVKRRQVLHADGAVGVVTVHQFGHVGCDRNGKLVVHRVVHVFHVAQHALQLRVVRVAARKLFLPRLGFGVVGLQFFVAHEDFGRGEVDGLQHGSLLKVHGSQSKNRCRRYKQAN